MMTVICKSIYGEEKVVKKEDLQFAISIYAVVMQDAKVLISPQWCENGYDFPGGHIDLGEDNIDALVREVKEETGFTVKPGKAIGAYTSFFIHPRTKKYCHSIQIYYSAEIVSGAISADGFDEGEKSYAKEACFVTLPELKQMKFMNSNQTQLKDIFSYLEENCD